MTDNNINESLPPYLATEFIDSMPICFSYWNEAMDVIYCNQAYVALFDLQNKEEYKARYSELSPEFQPDGRTSHEAGFAYIKAAFTDGKCKFDWMHKDSKGKELPTEVTLVRVLHNEKTYLACYLRDMRDHYENMHKLRTAEQHTKILLDACPLGTLIWDKDYNLIGSNEAIAKMFGLEKDYEFIDNFPKLIPEFQPDGINSLERMNKVLQDAFTTGFVQTYWMGQTIDKTPVPTDVIVVRVEHNNEYMLAVYVKDLREIEESRQKVQAAEEFASAMINSAPIGISILDATFKRIECNNTMVTMFGFKSKQEAIENVYETMPRIQPNGEESFELSRKKYFEVWEKGEINFEVMAKHTDGSDMPVDVKLVRTAVNGKDIIINYMRDLREIKSSIKKIQEAETRVRAILDASPLCINVFDKHFNLLDCNEAGWKLFGFTNKRSFINNFGKLFPRFQSDGRLSKLMIRDALTRAMQYGEFRIKTLAKTMQGEDVPCDVTLKRIMLNGEPAVLSYVQDQREINAALDKAHTATQAAENSAKAKSEFLANMSHEIRTPMNGILGLLHILSHTSLTSNQQDYVGKAVFSANNLLRIINDILDFSKIEAGKLEIEEIPFTIHDVCSELQSLFMPQIEAKKLTFLLTERDFSTRTILGDPVRLKQVLLNLIGNAIKFTHEGSVALDITSTIHENNKLHCQFDVHDSGIGLTSEQMRNLFSAFTQADTSVTRKYGGTGLGLVISKRIVEMMNGKIWVESKVHKGSTFSFTAIFKLADEAILDVQKEQLPAANIAQRTAHLLLVEDNDINQMIAEELLTSVGYTLDIANNGQEALEMLAEKDFDLVLMDIQMPVMDGLTATRKIREQEKFKSLPVIAMSAHAMIGDKEISLKNGMNDHVTKPISPAILYNTLDYWLNKK